MSLHGKDVVESRSFGQRKEEDHPHRVYKQQSARRYCLLPSSMASESGITSMTIIGFRHTENRGKGMEEEEEEEKLTPSSRRFPLQTGLLHKMHFASPTNPTYPHCQLLTETLPQSSSLPRCSFQCLIMRWRRRLCFSVLDVHRWNMVRLLADLSLDHLLFYRIMLTYLAFLISN